MSLRRAPLPLVVLLLIGCGGSGGSTSSESSSSSSGSERPASDEFQLSSSDDAGQARGDHPSQITATATEAAMRLFVVDPDVGPIPGIVVKLTGADGRAFYTGETDSAGYAEVLVPTGQRYELEYLSLGRRTTSARVEVPTGPRQDIRLTLRYRRHRRTAPAAASTTTAAAPEQERLVLEDVLFESNSATITPDSFPRLDRVVEYLVHRPSARLRISGHTDNLGDPRRNLRLSEQRAQAVRDYLVQHGIDAGRVEAIGVGDAEPVAPNDTEEGRAQNRRIEVVEL
ncbi:OmpA family protein [Sandaracinus amylolyticus]|uniref:Outer membrane protein n=1 Tax=Sandaracinus amylolyticus TaxID=927083 RepID=A0A0F6VZ26_9BACT|nr:OmpA family protein [Sandaracinus amylolyticus]AKF03273.1 Outer membrane protein [Sandaracinus amylolyticus]